MRSAARDAAAPGFAMQRWVSGWRRSLDLERWPWTADSAPLTTAALPHEGFVEEALQQEIRRLRAELALEQKKLADYDTSLGPVSRTSAQAPPSVTRAPARIIHRSTGELAPAGVVIGTGRIGGIEPNAIAVTPTLLTAGTEAEIPSGATVLAGASVVGRTEEVGAWTSTLLPITSASFRAHVWIVRDAAGRTTFGDEGILEGDGQSGCRLKYVPSTAVVAIGDHVYSRDPSGRITQPLYYGRIDRAELRPGAPHWEIHVRPGIDLADVSDVHVLIAREPPQQELVSNP